MANAAAPQWVHDALKQSPAQSDRVDAMLQSIELAPLWNTLPDRTVVRYLPELVAFVWDGRELPKSEKWTPAEQRARAKLISKHARALNRELLAFQPLLWFDWWQIAPQEDPDAHALQLGLPAMAAHDERNSLLLRLAWSADRFSPLARTVERPEMPRAKETYLVRQIAVALGATPAMHAFLAALVNAVAGTEWDWDAERVRKSLSKKSKSR